MDLVVGVGDMKLSNDPQVVLVTYSLGSCIGVGIYDPQAGVAGLLHYMLPESNLDKKKAQKNPCMFGDTGIPLLFRSAYEWGAKKSRIKIIVAGGAQILDQAGLFNIGKRNHTLLRKLFWKNNVMIDYEDVGGTVNRTLKMAVKDGEVSLKVSGLGVKTISWK
jgi:chemotaxis protein CheD